MSARASQSSGNIGALRRRLEAKAELKRKCELLLKIYEEDRVKSIKDATRRYKAAGRAALEAWLEYAAEPKPYPSDLLRSAGFSPEALDLEPSDQ
ncbi:hypothetical protein EmuJ_001014550 [Echinococcus multilocularis]|uniref:Uncharacterized protein n=1 Tax=Echinococcus multilocularis TaxID=6211 RepID=A0A068YJJ3_ECHMU|nr:hypothetical protein EmuJ_001014550 [Echinococcus multilocularis]